MRNLLVFIFAGLLFVTAQAQPEVSVNDVRNIFDEKGDYYFDRKEYKKAIVYYNMAFDSDAKNYYSVLRKAEAYEAMGLYDQAAESYRILFESGLYIPNEHRLHFALLLLKNKDVKGFEKQMAEYNAVVHSEIHGYLSDLEVRARMYKDSSLWVVENENILNTPESETCPAVYKDRLVFASTRKNLAAYGANPYYSLFSALYTEGGRPGKLGRYPLRAGPDMSVRSIAFAERENRIYITVSAAERSGLKTYTAALTPDGDPAAELKVFAPDGISSMGHVCFNSDGTKMYFVSDAPGGEGGLDIWVCEKTGQSWSKAVNPGKPINTPGDEMYPFILNDTMLFFASDGHGGQGGLDLFRVNLKVPGSAPGNLGSGINSSSDDYALRFSPGGLTAYFCSDRPGGFGKTDIYRLHMLDIKVKLAAYKFKRKTTMEKDKINLYLSGGAEYNIASRGNDGFNFGFRPEEPYKMVIRHENPLATDIMYNKELTPEQRKAQFLKPKPLERTEIRLDPGMKYEFTAGLKPIADDYKESLRELSQAYQDPGSSTIDLTALAKELFMQEGEVYTIRFMKDENRLAEGKSKETTSLFVNDQVVEVSGEAFFIVLPLDIQANFNIETDLQHFQKNFNPKKVGSLKVDAEPVLKKEPVKESQGFPVLVNTESFSEVIPGKEIRAKELTIIPGSMYILTFDRTHAPDEDMGVIIPLTKGVKYNLGTESQSLEAYQKALSKMNTGQDNASGELIDIAVLSKELDIASEKDVVFYLTPAKEYGQQEGGRSVLTTLAVDGRKYYITKMQRLQVNLKLPENEKVNIQTDLAYIEENFDESTLALHVDTSPVSRDIEEARQNLIKDPVFDVIVINFDLGDYAIRPDAKTVIAEEVIGVLKGDTRLYVTIKGYTDPLGDTDYNEKLSMNRAQAVKDFLTGNGIAESRIRTFSYGETLSLKAGQRWEDMSEEELKQHRKVEIVIYLPK